MYHTRPWILQRQALEPKHKEWAAMLDHLDAALEVCLTCWSSLNSGQHHNLCGDNGYSHWGYFGRPSLMMIFVKNKGPWPKGKFASTHEGGVRVPFVYWKDKIKAEKMTTSALYDLLATAADLPVSCPRKQTASVLTDIARKPNEQQTHEYLYWENGMRSQHAQSVA